MAQKCVEVSGDVRLADRVGSKPSKIKGSRRRLRVITTKILQNYYN